MLEKGATRQDPALLQLTNMKVFCRTFTLLSTSRACMQSDFGVEGLCRLHTIIRVAKTGLTGHMLTTDLS